MRNELVVELCTAALIELSGRCKPLRLTMGRRELKFGNQQFQTFQEGRIPQQVPNEKLRKFCVDQYTPRLDLNQHLPSSKTDAVHPAVKIVISFLQGKRVKSVNSLIHNPVSKAADQKSTKPKTPDLTYSTRGFAPQRVTALSETLRRDRRGSPFKPRHCLVLTRCDVQEGHS